MLKTTATRTRSVDRLCQTSEPTPFLSTIKSKRERRSLGRTKWRRIAQTRIFSLQGRGTPAWLRPRKVQKTWR